MPDLGLISSHRSSITSLLCTSIMCGFLSSVALAEVTTPVDASAPATINASPMGNITPIVPNQSPAVPSLETKPVLSRAEQSRLARKERLAQRAKAREEKAEKVAAQAKLTPVKTAKATKIPAKSSKKDKKKPTLTGMTQPPPLLWQTRIQGQIVDHPVIQDHFLYVVTDANELIAVNLDSGLIQWQKTLMEVHRPTAPAINGNTLFLGAEEGVYALSKLSGEKLWFFATPQPVSGTPVLEQQRLFTTCKDGKLYALDTTNGSVVWTYEADALLEGALTLYLGILFLGDYDGNVYAINAADGKLKWKEHIEGPLVRAPLVDAKTETVYFSSGVGAMFALFTGNGAKKWSYTSATGAPIMAQPAIEADQAAYVADTDGRIGGVQQPFGLKTWQHIPNKGGVYGSLKLIAPDTILAITEEGTMMGYRTDGETLWESSLKAYHFYDPIVDLNRLFMASKDGQIFAFNLKTPTTPSSKRR